MSIWDKIREIESQIKDLEKENELAQDQVAEFDEEIEGYKAKIAGAEEGKKVKQDVIDQNKFKIDSLKDTVGLITSAMAEVMKESQSAYDKLLEAQNTGGAADEDFRTFEKETGLKPTAEEEAPEETVQAIAS
jgi:chromosome segregation ATPase